MNGFDHALPEPHAGVVADALAHATGWTVTRGLLEDFASLLPAPAVSFRGDLLGARTANLLPGVWSARMPLKLRNRRAEALLEGWTEPWAALGARSARPTSDVAARGLARAPPESGPRLDRRVLARPRPRADAGALRCG